MASGGFRVAGMLDRTLYEVEVTGDRDQPVVGSKRVRALIRQLTGEKVLVTPVGPAYIVDPADADSVLAALCAHSHVIGVSDNAPQLVDPRPEGAVW